MATISVRVPEDVHIIVCRGRDAAEADHEVISTRDLQVFLEAHIMRHLRVRFGPATFNWVRSEDWRSFLQGELVQIKVHLDGGEGSFSVTLKRGDDSRIVYLNRMDVG